MFVDSHNLKDYSFEEFKRNLSVTFQPADIRRKAEQELAGLRQKPNEAIKEFILWFHQCIIEAQYNIGAHGRFLIQILRNAVKQELVEFVEISQVQLINSDELDDWIHALIQVERIKTKQKAQKATSTGHSNTPARSWNANPRALMDISKARAEGRCAKCSKPWPCKDHMRKWVICQMTSRNQQISYTTAEELVAEINHIEKDFPVGEQI